MFKINILISLLLFIIITVSSINQREEMKKQTSTRSYIRNTRSRLHDQGLEIDPKTHKKIPIKREEESNDDDLEKIETFQNEIKKKIVKKTQIKEENIVETNESKVIEDLSLSKASKKTEQSKKKEKKEKTTSKKTSATKKNVKKVVEEVTMIEENDFNITPYQKQLVKESRKSDPNKFDKFNMNLDAEIGLMEFLDTIKNNESILSQLQTEEKKEESKSKKIVKKGWNQVTEIFTGNKKCKYYTGFSKKEFKTVLVYCTHICEFDKENGWIKVTETNDVGFEHPKISIEYALFIFMVYIKKFPSNVELFYLVQLERYYEETNASQTISEILPLIINSKFVQRGIQSMVWTLRDANLKDVPTLEKGYHPIFNFVVKNLNKCHYIVDGRHQPISKKLDENGRYENDYYSWKHHRFGVKYNIYVDASVKCVDISPVVPAKAHDTYLHNVTVSDKLVPDGTYVVGDSGYTGAKKCLHVYREPNKPSQIKVFSYVAKCEDIKIEITRFDEENMNPLNRIGKCVCFIRGTFMNKITDPQKLIDLKEGTEAFYCDFEGKVNGYLTSELGILKEKSTFELDGKGIIMYDYGNKAIYLLTFSGTGVIYMREGDAKKIEGKLVIEKEGILGRNVNEKSIELYNALLSKVRVKVEQHFGRLMILFKITSSVYTKNLDHYTTIIQFCHALTNYHLHIKPVIKFPFYLIHRQSKQLMNSEPDKVIKRIPIPLKAQKLMKEICGTKKCHDFFENYIAEKADISINRKGSMIINEEWTLDEDDFDEKQIDQKIRDWMKSTKLYPDDVINTIDIKKEIYEIGKNKEFPNVVNFIKKKISASNAFQNLFQNDQEIEDYAKNIIEEMRLKDIDAAEITMIDDENINLNPNVYSKGTLNERIDYVNSRIGGEQQISGIKRKGKCKKLEKHEVSKDENVEIESMILKNLNIKKRKMEEKEQKRKEPEHDMEEDISEIPSNDKLVKALNKTQGNESDVVYVGSKKKEKTSNRSDVVEINMSKDYMDISPKLEGEWVHSIILELFLYTTKNLFENTHYIVPMNTSELLIAGNSISINVQMDINLNIRSNKIIHIIVNKNGNHWICLTLDCIRLKLHIIDSLREKEDTMREYLKNVIQFFQELLNNELELSFVNIPMQKSSWECGFQIMFYLLVICTQYWVKFETLETYFDERRYDSFLQLFSRIKENIYKSIQKEKETKIPAYLVFAESFYFDSLNALKSIL